MFLIYQRRNFFLIFVVFIKFCLIVLWVIRRTFWEFNVFIIGLIKMERVYILQILHFDPIAFFLNLSLFLFDLILIIRTIINFHPFQFYLPKSTRTCIQILRCTDLRWCRMAADFPWWSGLLAATAKIIILSCTLICLEIGKYWIWTILFI